MILDAIERRWRQEPDLRLGQLIVSVMRERGNVERDAEGTALFALQDGKLLDWLDPETEQERRYIADEPRAAREGWRQWERARREHEH